MTALAQIADTGTRLDATPFFVIAGFALLAAICRWWYLAGQSVEADRHPHLCRGCDAHVNMCGQFCGQCLPPGMAEQMRTDTLDAFRKHHEEDPS